MIKIIRAAIVLIVLAVPASTVAEESRTNLSLRLEIDLVDGSHLVGVPTSNSIPVRTPYARMEIPWAQIRSIQVKDDRETVSLELVNDDKLEGILNTGEVGLQTLFGRTSIGLQHISSMDVRRGSSLGSSFQKGLVLHYSFDREQGKNLNDESPQHTVGEVLGATWTGEGHHGGAYAFDGKDDYISLPRTVQDSFVISAWIKTTAAGGGTAHYQSMPIYDSEIALQITCDFGFGVNSDGQLVFGEGGGGADATITGKTRVNTGAWVHACAVRDKETGEMEIYVNGKSDARGVGSTATLNANPKARIGYGFDNPGNVQYWNGQMDDVMIWNRTLSETEIEQIYNCQR